MGRATPIAYASIVNPSRRMLAALLLSIGSCLAAEPASDTSDAPSAPDTPAARARAALGQYVTPLEPWQGDKPAAKPLVDLGRVLFFDARLSRGRDMSCNSCHSLRRFGVPSLSTRRRLEEAGRLRRKIPTVYNAANQYALYWDSRAATIEQASGMALLSKSEMGMADEAAVLARINAVPGYGTLFANAFPDAEAPVTFEHIANALGAFQRGLVTPAPFDDFLRGDDAALTDTQLNGLMKFHAAGCTSCHTGPNLGGQMLQKVGVVRPWPNQRDRGRYDLTKKSADVMMFKVATLRNIERTWPYFHDNSAITLSEAVRKMAWYELGQAMPDADVDLIVDFFKSLTGDRPKDYIEEPDMPK